MDLKELIHSRYSVRDFRPDPIPEDVLQEILEAGRLAPSAQNRQPWRYIVFNDPKDIRALAKKTGLIGLSNFFIKDAPVVIIACAD
ncbi:MAG: nitroreductase family protein [Candidatus Cloacimonetes bacterium]|nr:nitroreductase family protein [Candidatus Cloacimonadota bacterium]MCK9185123.1 nitroreductase family protein [Candidatus Cloacimonadota bacterium]